MSTAKGFFLVRVFKISIVSSELGNGTYMAFPSLPGLRMVGSTTSILVGIDLASVVSKGRLCVLGSAASKKKDITRDSMKNYHLTWLRKPWTLDDYDKLLISIVDLEVIILYNFI